MDHLYQKVAEIKEKIKILASNLQVMRSENEVLSKENQNLRSTLHQNAAEIRYLKAQLTNYKEKLDDQALN